MRTEAINCDLCGADLTWTGNAEDWRIALLNEPIRFVGGGPATCMAIAPKLKSNAHFCDAYCLHEWVIKLKIPEHVIRRGRARRARIDQTPEP